MVFGARRLHIDHCPLFFDHRWSWRLFAPSTRGTRASREISPVSFQFRVSTGPCSLLSVPGVNIHPERSDLEGTALRTGLNVLSAVRSWTPHLEVVWATLFLLCELMRHSGHILIPGLNTAHVSYTIKILLSAIQGLKSIYVNFKKTETVMIHLHWFFKTLRTSVRFWFCCRNSPYLVFYMKDRRPGWHQGIHPGHHMARDVPRNNPTNVPRWLFQQKDVSLQARCIVPCPSSVMLCFIFEAQGTAKNLEPPIEGALSCRTTGLKWIVYRCSFSSDHAILSFLGFFNKVPMQPSTPLTHINL